MNTAEDEIRELQDTLPEDATLEDIQYHIYVRMKVGQGLAAAERGEVVSQEELEASLGRWTAKVSAPGPIKRNWKRSERM